MVAAAAYDHNRSTTGLRIELKDARSPQGEWIDGSFQKVGGAI